MRFISNQFLALLDNHLWREIADHGHQLALYLKDQVQDIPEIQVTQPVEANAVFAKIPRKWIKALRKKFFFYIFNEQTFEARWMMSYDSTKEDIDQFIQEIYKIRETWT